MPAASKTKATAAHRAPSRRRPAPVAAPRPRGGGPRGGQARPVTRAERRRAAQTRRSRVLLVASVVLSGLILAAWFPASALLHQRREVSAAAAQLGGLRGQDQALAQERQRLNDPAEIQRLARQQYQLVTPGQRAYQVLPPSSAAPGASSAGDPGLKPVVTPSAAQELPPGATTTAPARSGSSGAVRGHRGTPSAGPPRASGGFFGRVLQTLEFWR